MTMIDLGNRVLSIVVVKEVVSPKSLMFLSPVLLLMLLREAGLELEVSLTID